MRYEKATNVEAQLQVSCHQDSRSLVAGHKAFLLSMFGVIHLLVRWSPSFDSSVTVASIDINAFIAAVHVLVPVPVPVPVRVHLSV